MIQIKKCIYNKLKQLFIKLNVDFSDNLLTLQNINQLFQQGLLLVVKSECQMGISGEGKGMYFSEAKDWKIL